MSTLHPTRYARKSGFTLIEVAIALALFVVGALAIVRIFPPALQVIRNNESRITATQLGEATLAKLRSKYTPPPEAVYDIDDDGNWQDYPASVVETASKGSTLPTAPQDSAYDLSGLGRFRYIYGEPHYIASGQYILLNRPRSATTKTGVSIPVTAFYDEMIEGVQITSSGYVDFSNAYSVSSSNSHSDATPPALATSNNIVPPPDTARRDDGVTYYISYRWRECLNVGCTTYSSIKGVSEEPLSIPEDSDWTSTSGRVLPASVNSANQIIPGAVQVRMRRNFTPTVNAVGNAEYATVSASATAPGMYYVNYLSSDWRVLVDDNAPTQKVGAATTGIVRLPINGLDDTFTPTGFLTRSDQKVAATALASSNTNYKTGEIEYTITTWDSPRVRTIYRAIDNWAHQLSVAPRAYIPYDSNRGTVDFPREPWREYHWSSTDAGLMYFHPSEAGKTVAISYIDGSGNKLESISTIEDDFVDKPASVATGFIGPGNTNSKVARMFITDLAGNNIPASSILSVRGLSVRARTAWLNNDRYNQVIVPGYRALSQTG